MKYLRWGVFILINLLFLMPLNILVTIFSLINIDYYTKYRDGFQAKVFDTVFKWAEGNKTMNKT